MRVLHVNHWLPVEPLDGGRIRKRQHLAALADEHEVTVVGRARRLDDPAALGDAIRGLVVEVAPDDPTGRTSGVLSCVRGLLASTRYDVVHVSGVAQWPGERGLAAAAGDPKVVVDFDSVESVVLRRMAEAGATGVTRDGLAGVTALERAVVSRADCTLVCSEADRTALGAIGAEGRVEVVPNGVDGDHFACSAAGAPRPVPRVTFTGFLAYWPNADACAHLVGDILPLVRRRFGRVSCRLVGRVPPAAVMALQHEDEVQVVPNVPDIRPWMRESDLLVAPIRAGAGTRLKILEAFAIGRPIVSTSIGCEGLEVQSGRHLLVADGAEPFADAIARLLTDRAVADRLAREARNLVETRYDCRITNGRLLEVYRSLSGR